MATAHDAQRVAAPESAEPVISHFIPSVELAGSREDKLRKLDTLIDYLHELRKRLAGDATVSPVNTSRVSGSAWQWFTAGAVIGAVCVLLFITARLWGL